jgi:hypothetical protein
MNKTISKEDFSVNEHLEDIRERMRILRKLLSPHLPPSLCSFSCLQRVIVKSISIFWKQINLPIAKIFADSERKAKNYELN